MSYAVPRVVVEAFYAAYESRDPRRIAEFLDANVDWQVYGPAEVMQVCGHWRGKAAVIDRFARVIPNALDQVHIESECLLVEGDHSAMYGRINSRQKMSQRVISHRVSHFIRFRDGKVVQFRCINDSLDAVEQFIGHRIDLSADADASESDIVAL